VGWHAGITAALLFAAGGALGATNGPAMASVPSNGSMVLKDYGYRSWGPELVHYQVNTNTFQPGKLVLLDPSSSAIPFQISNSVLSFVARVSSNQTVTYTLQSSATDRSGDNSSLTVQTVSTNLEIGNALFTLRLPAPQSQSFGTPVDVNQAPVPLVGVKHAGCSWYGGSHFVSDHQLTSYSLGLIENGKASVTYEARYGFSGGGQYVCRIQVVNGLAYALFTEEFDFGAMTQGHDFLLLDLSSGWSPDTYRYMYGGFGGGESPLQTGAITTSGLSSYVSTGTTTWNNWKVTDPPKPYQPGSSSLVLLDRLSQTGSYGPRSAVGLSSSSQATYFLPMHGGIWRRSMSLTVWNDPSSGVKIALPISVRPQDTYLEVGGDNSPFWAGTHDSGVSQTYGRRMWALCCGLSDTAVANVHQQAGVIGLDRYKNWTLSWTYDSSKTFPRAQTTPALATRLKNAINSHPEKDKLQTCYVITGNAQDAVNSANLALTQLRTPSQYLTSFTLTWAFIGYRDCDFSFWIIRAEDALSYAGLSSSLRDELRQRLAIFAYFHAEPDLAPMGTATHLGTMNMRVGRLVPGINFASLLPDHPAYDYWMAHYRDVTSYLLGTMESIGGAWYEPPTYQMYGPTRWLTTAQTILRNGGFLDYGPKGYQTRMLQYTADITMPDPRYPNKRILPGMGDSGNTLEGMFGIGMGVVESSDTANAQFFSYMHGLNGINQVVSRSGSTGDTKNPDFSFFYMNDVGSQSRELVTSYIPGYGVTFRGHYGNANETAMIFRCGYTRSHWAVDDQNVILYGKGAPLSPGNAFQYYHGVAEQTGPMRNVCRLVQPTLDPPNGRIHTDVQDYGFGTNADYAVGRMYFTGEELGDGKGEMEWRRHILFLKSSQPTGPNYFVMQDSFTGYEGAPTNTGRTAYWTWLNLDTADRVTVNGTAFNASQVANETVISESSWPALTGNTVEMGTAYGASSWFWFDTPTTPTVKAVMKMNYTVDPADYQRTFGSLQAGIPATSSAESKTIFRIQGSADSGFFYVLYPRKGSEATPTCTRLAAGVLKIITSESTDYVFVGDSAFNYNSGGVVFSGKAGAVRVFSDHVVFCMNSGTGSIGYNGYSLNGSGLFEQSVFNANLTPGTTSVGGTAKTIQTVDIGSGMTVRGEGPFIATLNGTEVQIHTEGRARQFIIAYLPSWLLNAQFALDGQEWLCLPSDQASQNWGRYPRSSGVCFSTVDGSHDLVLRQRANWPSPWADMMSASIVTTIPAAPTNLTATTVSDVQINLSWTDAANNEGGFKIERKTGPGGTYSQITSGGVNVTTYQDTGLTASTQYYYRVRASNGAGDSTYSNEATATTQAPPPPPAAPSGLGATAASDTQINLSWTDNATNESGFKIERKTGASGTYSQIATVGAGVTTYQDAGLTASTQYYYRVRATNTGGDSDYSNEANATTQPPPPPPAAPTGLGATAVSGSQINLAWSDNATNESGFKIERKTGSGGTYIQIATVGTGVTVYQDTGLAGSTQYYYRVRATNLSGDSAYSNEANSSTWDTVAAPVFGTPPGIYSAEQSVYIGTATPGASIRYTTDGSTPAPTNGTLYSAPVTLSVSCTLKAIAYKSGMTDSSLTSGTYTIGEPGWDGLLQNNNIPSRDGTLYTNLTNAGYIVLLYGNCQTVPNRPAWWSGAATYTQVSGTRTTYDWNGMRWNGTNRVPLCGEGDLRGGVAKITITNNVASPVIKKMAVIFTTWDSAGSTSVQLTSIKVGAVTTTFNQALTASAGKASVGKVLLPVRPSEVIEITLTYPSVNWSGISLAFENTNSSGTVPAAPSGLAASAASDSQINLSWTDNATNETGFKIERKTGAGGTYSQIATVGAGVTTCQDAGLAASTQYYYRVRASNGAGDSAYSNEAIATTQAPPQVAAPTFSPAAGSYAGPQSVVIGSTTGGATIRYTTDGSAPSQSAGTLYSAPVLLSCNTTLKAIACKSGMTDSAVTSGGYVMARPVVRACLTTNGWVEVTTTVWQGVTCEWLVSSNLVDWASAGTNTASVAGEVVWQEGPTSHSGPRFFRVRYR
jgi:transcriptional regulator CtsR